MSARFGPSLWSVYLQAIALHKIGRRSEAEAIHRELTERASREHVQPTPLAMVAASLGRMDEAYAQVERALEERDAYLLFSLSPWPNFAELQSDPAWADVRRRLGLDGK